MLFKNAVSIVQVILNEMEGKSRMDRYGPGRRRSWIRLEWLKNAQKFQLGWPAVRSLF